jgi:hypothetical protein
MSVESHGEMIVKGENRRTRIKTCLSGILSATNPIWTDPSANPGFCAERSATNRLSHGKAFQDYTLAYVKREPLKMYCYETNVCLASYVYCSVFVSIRR